MTNQKLDNLVARVEAATGPDRWLDGDLALVTTHVGWIHHPYVKEEAKDNPNLAWGCAELWPSEQAFKIWRDGSVNVPAPNVMAPAYTSNVGAALTLIPDGLWWVLAKGRYRPDEPLYGVQLRNPTGPDAIAAEAEHEVFVLAIVLAALKARNA